jgi:AraC-like DNA-binding protein
LSRWREEFGRAVVHLDFEPLADAPFHAEAVLYALPGVRIALLKGSAARYMRTQALCADGDDAVSLIISRRRRWIASQRGRDVALGCGDGIALLHAEPAVGIRSQGSHLVVVVPREVLATRVADVENATMQLISRRTEALQLLVAYLELVRRDPHPGTSPLHQSVAAHVQDLTALAITAHQAVGDSELGAVTAARLDTALGRIAESFENPALNVTMVAQSLGISSRYLQRLLEIAGTSFTERVTELRLQRVFAQLSSGEDGRSISDIAYRAGFSDLSHFNRLFRARFGDTPSGVRRLRRRA